MTARDVIVRPIITEKSMKAQSELNCVTFEVAKGTNKVQIRQAVEEIFNVKVVRVNVINTPTKQKRMGRYVGTVGGIRKAIVKLADGDSINFFD